MGRAGHSCRVVGDGGMALRGSSAVDRTDSVAIDRDASRVTAPVFPLGACEACARAATWRCVDCDRGLCNCTKRVGVTLSNRARVHVCMPCDLDDAATLGGERS